MAPTSKELAPSELALLEAWNQAPHPQEILHHVCVDNREYRVTITERKLTSEDQAPSQLLYLILVAVGNGRKFGSSMNASITVTPDHYILNDGYTTPDISPALMPEMLQMLASRLVLTESLPAQAQVA